MAWYAILLAGGSGNRMGAGCNKCLLTLEDEPVLCRSMRAFRGLVAGVVLVTRDADMEECRKAVAAWQLEDMLTACVSGGSDRQASVSNGLDALPGDCDCVLVHDAARALVSQEVIRLVMDSVKRCGTGVAAIPVVDTIKDVDERECVSSTPERSRLRAVQTPQGFTKELLMRAHAQADADGFRGTDDASLVERLGVAVQLTHGSADNIKLTTPRDMDMARVILASRVKRRKPMLRVGQGYDVHRLTEGRKLILCGVEIPHDTGLLGHSDADVALHALMDALLGAMGLGDIGKHFPDTDPAYKGASSMKLTENVALLLRKHGAHPVNVDVTIVAQKPKLAPFIPLMRTNVASVLDMEEDCVSIKATTTEKLGFEGEEKGISAQAVCLVEQE